MVKRQGQGTLTEALNAQGITTKTKCTCQMVHHVPNACIARIYMHVHTKQSITDKVDSKNNCKLKDMQWQGQLIKAGVELRYSQIKYSQMCADLNGSVLCALVLLTIVAFSYVHQDIGLSHFSHSCKTHHVLLSCTCVLLFIANYFFKLKTINIKPHEN